jgi:hypothetical protein
MKWPWLAAIIAMAASAPAWAQSTSGTGVGIAGSTSSSQAVSGQGGTGVGVAAITTNSTVPADQTVRNVPGIVAPGLAAAGLETCLGSVSGGGAFVGTGFSFGTTIPDPGCAARLDARTLWSFGLKKAAVARLCLNPDINRAMPEVCVKYLPRPAPGHPAPTPVSTRYAHAEALEEPPYTGGDIWLVEGATGKNRLCSDYDVIQQSCVSGLTSLTIRRRRRRRQRVVKLLTRRHLPPRHPPWRQPKRRKSHNEEAVDEYFVHRSGGKHFTG